MKKYLIVSLALVAAAKGFAGAAPSKDESKYFIAKDGTKFVITY